MCVSRFRERQQTRPPGDLPSGYITAILHHERLLSIQKGLPVGSESFDVSDAFRRQSQCLPDAVCQRLNHFGRRELT